jgi:hypothetical protein
MNSGNGQAGSTGLHVDGVVRAAEHEIRELLQQRADLMKRLGTIKQTLAGLADMFGESILSDELLQLLERKTVRHSGFTRACRTVLMGASIPLNARQVRDRIQEVAPELLVRHKDPLASITTVLTRLVQYSEARCITLGPGRRAWEWISDRSAHEKVLAPLVPEVVQSAAND